MISLVHNAVNLKSNETAEFLFSALKINDRYILIASFIG
jgi:hypothetical protein